MSTPHALALHLQHLLAALSRQGARHLTEVQTDLRQTEDLLSEAIEKLSASFIGIHGAMNAQHVAIDTLRADPTLPPAMLATLARLQQESALHVNAAITALQFQDMTSQLIGRIVGHVESLGKVLDGVGASGAMLAADSDGASVLAVLVAVNRMLDESGPTEDHVSRRVVAQTHMDSGDIELF